MGETRTVLVVDDDSTFRDQIRPCLRQLGLTVIEAASLAEAAGAFAAHAFDLLVVDGILPDGKGATFIEGLRRAGVATPVVYVAALWKDLQAFRHLGERLDLALITHKPVVPAILAEEIAGVLSERDGDVEVTFTEEDLTPPAGQRQFLRVLPGVLAELLCAVTLAQSSGDPALRGEARRAAGRLRVVAGPGPHAPNGQSSSSYDELAGIAGRIDDALASLDLEEPAVHDVLWREIEHHLDAAMQAARDVTPIAPEGEHRGRVLVVNPDTQAAQKLVALGQRLDLEVTIAGSAADAVARARKVPPDCAVVHHHCPGDRLGQLVRELRALPGCEALPVALTAPGGPHASVAAGVGASMILVEPVDAAAFESAMGKLLAIGRARRPRVLVLDDDAAFARQVAAVLGREGIATTHLSDPRRVMEVLDEVEPDLVLLDSILPFMAGLDVCRLLRTSQRWQDLPIIYCTVEMGLDVRLAAFHAGVDDYLARPVVGPELLSRVRVRLERSRLLADRGSTDALTGLLQRRAFLEAAAGRLSEAQRAGRPLTVTLTDIDGLGELNQAHGHEAGDQVLATVGRLLRSRLRAEDLRGRWGSDEMALVFAGHDADTTRLVLARLMEAFERMTFRGHDGAPFRARLSAGVASYPEDGRTLPELVATAEARLASSKQAHDDEARAAA